jgi:hypothetical protein
MTFTVRTRGATDGAIDLEYLCPEHGHFTATVPRATSPDELPCSECGASSPWSPSSAPAFKQQLVSAGSMGKSEPRPHAGFLDTRPMAEGQRYHRWKQDRAKHWEGVRQRKVMEAKR